MKAESSETRRSKSGEFDRFCSLEMYQIFNESIVFKMLNMITLFKKVSKIALPAIVLKKFVMLLLSGRS